MQTTTNTFITLTLNWLAGHGIQVAAVIIIAWLVHLFGGASIERLVRKVIVPSRFSSREAEKKREDTLIRIFSASLGILVWIIAGLMILQELGFEVGPLLAAAGVAGLAFGFGGQYLIRDLISGLFIILENQYRIGDIVCIDGVCGSVEDISLRMTTLRDLDGTVHHIPHGEIKKVANCAKEFARINIDIGVSYDADLEQVMAVVNEVGQALASDAEWQERIITAPTFLRVEDFADSAVMIKILGEVKPLKQWEVAGELRKRLKIAFDKAGIEIPFPQRVLHQVKKK